MAAVPNRYDVGDQIVLEAYVLSSPTLGTIGLGANTVTLQDGSGYSTADPILVKGAGPLGADLVTTVSSISGSQAVLAANCETAVTRALVGKPTAATVICNVRLPDGTDSPAGVTAVSTGRYRSIYTPAASGSHFYRFTCSGGASGAEEQQFVVREQRA